MITTVINYCSNDYRYLKFTIREALHFSDSIIVVCADHFFDGSPENRSILHHSYGEFPNVSFIEYVFDEDKPYGLYPRKRDEDLQGVQYWHSTSRYIGFHYLPDECQYVLFLDADEIPDGRRMKEWLANGLYLKYDAIRFTCYYYFKRPENRAKKETRCGLLLKRSTIDSELLLDVHERRGTFLSLKGEKLEDVRSLDHLPLFHHYSWVKTKEEAFKKASTWGHKHDRQWQDDIEREFSPTEDSEKIYELNYEKVEPFCDPLSIQLPKGEAKGPFPNVTRVNPQKIFQRSIELLDR